MSNARKSLARVCTLIVAVVAILSFAPHIAGAASTTLFDNTGVLEDTSNAAGVEVGQSFSTGAIPVNLTSVAFDWSNGATSSSYSLQLYGSNAGQPSGLMATLASNVAVAPSAQGPTTYPVALPITLLPNSQYFVVVSGDNGGTMGWKFNNSVPTTDVSPAPSYVSLVSSDGGATWTPASLPANTNYIMQVVGNTLTVPTISGFSNLSANLGDPNITLAAVALDGVTPVPGAFVYAAENPAVAQVVGDQLMITGAGMTSISAQFIPNDPTTYFTATTMSTLAVSTAPPPPPVTTTSTTTTTVVTTTPTTTVPPTTSTTTTQPVAVTTVPATVLPVATNSTTSTTSTTTTTTPVTTTPTT
ncbi:MAG TPA: choice-of-anchor R domain-containing protein, partial [Acidimicrobiales bacterium]